MNEEANDKELIKIKAEFEKPNWSKLAKITCDYCKKEISEQERNANNGLCNECKDKGISSEIV